MQAAMPIDTDRPQTQTHVVHQRTRLLKNIYYGNLSNCSDTCTLRFGATCTSIQIKWLSNS